MRIRRTFPIVLAVVIVAAAIILAVQLRKHAPPEAARLLPGADAFFYLNLKSARRANSGKELPAVSHDPEYERFIRETGFQFERDLDVAAFAIHYPARWPGGGSGGAAREPRFSEVLEGKFHSERLTDYLRQIAQSAEIYHSVDIFTIQLQGRALRVAVLSPDTVAASNHDDPAVIQGIVDRSKRLASPFGGPSLLRQYFKHVQLASLAWVVARVDPSAPGASAWNTVFIALTHSAETSVGTHGTDADVKALFDSLKVRQEDNRTILTASMPFTFLHKMVSESSPELNEPTAASPAQIPAKSK